jgi:phage terminase large subunit GpA-like protein
MLPRGIVPARGVILTAGVDCQQDRTEVHIVAFGPNARRWTVDYIVIPHHIGDAEGMAALNALLKATWKTERGLRLALDMMAVDVGTYTADIWAWAKKHPWNRVILVKGASTQNGPILLPMKFERRADGQALRTQKRAFMVNVAQMKADFYHWLAKDDPLERGHCAFAAGLGDEYYRQITSEVRVLKRARTGAVSSQWELVEPTRRNEGLDTMNYAEAAARRKKWLAMTDGEWAALDEARGAAPAEAQSDLFDASMSLVAEAKPAAPAPKPDRTVESETEARAQSWLGPRRTKKWL